MQCLILILLCVANYNGIKTNIDYYYVCIRINIEPLSDYSISSQMIYRESEEYYFLHDSEEWWLGHFLNPVITGSCINKIFVPGPEENILFTQSFGNSKVESMLLAFRIYQGCHDRIVVKQGGGGSEGAIHFSKSMKIEWTLCTLIGGGGG